MIPVLLLLLLAAAPLQEAMIKAAAPARGRVGAAAVVLEEGETASIGGSERFPMQSVYKFPIAMAVLAEVDAGRMRLAQTVRVEASDLVTAGQHSPIRDEHPHGAADYTLAEILRLNVSESDGTACDVLLRLLGGTVRVQNYLNSLGIETVRVATTEKAMGLDENAQYKNWATPLGAVALLRAFYEGKGLSVASRSLLLKLMTESPTGPKRLKGLLPADAVVAHKTGTSRTLGGVTAATNDIGIITLCDGRHAAVAVFISDSHATTEAREGVIAGIAREVWERNRAGCESSSPWRKWSGSKNGAGM
ncbi:MAG: class A beta-lactamase, partial [Bryobacteraceae bacterium]